MHQRIFTSSRYRSLTAALLAVWFTVQTVGGQRANAQVVAGPAVVAPTEDSEVAQRLRHGQKLQTERRWGEALTYYEDAHRDFPKSKRLEQQLDLARIQYDVGRRYDDASFRKLLITLREHQALDLYSEVLQKVDIYHVATPSWSKLVRRGARDLDVALSRRTFLNRHLRDVPQKRVDQFRREVQTASTSSVARTRIEARSAALSMARRAQSQLGLSSSAVILEYACAAVGSLDAYSAFLTGDQLGEVYSQIEGNFVGLGIELKADDGALLIVNVITGSPAAQDGLKKHDRIVAVNGQTTASLTTDKAADMLQGQAGTVVQLTIRDPQDRQRTVSIRRRHVEVPSVDEVKIADTRYGVGYFRLTSFQKTTSRDMDAALWKLHRAGMRSLVIDLRGNPGGLLTAAVDAVDKFVQRGGIVSTRGRSAREDLDYSAHQGGTWRVPLVVLIDGDSASASEIFAGAIRDHRRGTIVGQRSYGKGSVQGIFPLSSGGAGMRLTTAKFFSPAGHPFSNIGVTPHVVVRKVAKPAGVSEIRFQLTQTEDATLEAGLKSARQALAQR